MSLHRSSYAIKKELAPNLVKVIDGLGLESVGGLLTLLAETPGTSVVALKDLANARRTRLESARATKTTAAELAEKLRKGEVTPEQLEKMTAVVSNGNG